MEPRASDDLRWLDDESFELDGVTFTHGAVDGGGAADRLHLRKRRELAERYVELLAEFRGGDVVELGIAGGGSLALLALVAAPRRVAAVELAATPVAGLEAFVHERGLGDVVRTHWGVDQGDRRRLAAIVDEEFGDRPLDLVVDDASHHLDPSVASFEVLFPRLRPGGLYLLEDWSWQHKLASSIDEAATGDDPRRRARLEQRMAERSSAGRVDRERLAASLRARAADGDDDALAARLGAAAAMRRRAADPDGGGAGRGAPAEPAGPATDGRPPADPAGPSATEPPADGPTSGGDRPLVAMVVDLVLARAASGDAVAGLAIDEFWVAVRRGPAPLDPSTFRLADAGPDPFGLRWRPGRPTA